MIDIEALETEAEWHDQRAALARVQYHDAPPWSREAAIAPVYVAVARAIRSRVAWILAAQTL